MKTRTWLDMDMSKLDDFSTSCKSCKKVLDVDTTGMQKVYNGYLCDDCYYEEWGKFIDENPICNPLPHRIK